MKRQLSFFLLAGILGFVGAATAAEPSRAQAKSSPNRLLCKTGSEKRAQGQALKLYFNYNLPVTFEPQDPTLPFGRQTLLIESRPIMQLFFEKAPGAAGENGENLQPMQCAFARRAVRAKEPNQVRILMPGDQVHWISQGIGKQGRASERAFLRPPGDWEFADEHERVFAVELDDLKDFVSTQMPKPL